MVICNQCKRQYKQIFDNDNTQAMNCSAEIIEKNGHLKMYGFYGSTIADGNVYEVLTNTYKTGIICDSCIETGLENFHFKLISVDNYF